MINHFKHAEIFALSWNACTPTTFLSQGTFGKMMMGSKQNQKGKSNSKGDGSQSIFNNLLNFMNTGKRQFFFAIDQARVAGTLLGLYLTKSNFAENRTVTIIGYSLGSVVTFNCLRMMKRLYDFDMPRAGKVINDIQFWAGAYVIDISK